MYVANTTGGLMLQTMLYLANHTSRAAVNTLIDLPPAPKSGKYQGERGMSGGRRKRGRGLCSVCWNWCFAAITLLANLLSSVYRT